MAKKEKGTRQKKKKGRSTQELLGIKTFTKYGLAVGKYELLFYMIAPTNISVLSRANIEIKIHHLMMVLSAVPDIEVTCTDSCECFDDNKTYLQARLEEETNPKVPSSKMDEGETTPFLSVIPIRGEHGKEVHRNRRTSARK